MPGSSSSASSVCCICLEEDAPQFRVTRSSKRDNWLECDSCKSWFHAECGGYKAVEYYRHSEEAIGRLLRCYHSCSSCLHSTIMFLLRSFLQSELLVKIYFDVSTGCLHFEIYQEDTWRVSVIREKKKKKNVFSAINFEKIMTTTTKRNSSCSVELVFVFTQTHYYDASREWNGDMENTNTVCKFIKIPNRIMIEQKLHVHTAQLVYIK